MQLYATHDRPVIDRACRRIESLVWPILLPRCADLTFLVRQAVKGGNSVAQRWFRLPERRIRVSSMSSAWLRVHEADDDKHSAEI